MFFGKRGNIVDSTIETKRKKIKKMISDATEIHKWKFPLFKEFLSYLEKNNITYFLTGGTLLGCIRHGKRIPWDDDFDIFIYSKEMAKLLAINKQYNIVKNEWNFYYLYTKNNKRVFLDIFNENDTFYSKPMSIKPQGSILRRKFNNIYCNISSNYNKQLKYWYGNNYLTTYVANNHSNILNIQDGVGGIILYRNKSGKFIIQQHHNSKLSYQNKTSNNLATRFTFSIN